MKAAANPMSGRRSFALRMPSLETMAAWLLAIIWIFPLLYAIWAAFHPPAYMVRFDLFAPLTLDNFANAWAQAPFARYYLNTFLLVTGRKRSEEYTSELQSRPHLVCRLLLEKKKKKTRSIVYNSIIKR